MAFFQVAELSNAQCICITNYEILKILSISAEESSQLLSKYFSKYRKL